MKASRKGLIYCNGQYAGCISEFKTDLTGGKDSYLFEYDKAYILTGDPIGHAFPFNKTQYQFDYLPPFFENMISEGWVRTHQSQIGKLDKQDSFGLLLANGKDIIGALSVEPVDVNM
ncbi:HipA N-terminal domain-containing protein [Catenovulum sp. 2E275]|uniref:HipA N-terminal domain-containing protein n=1 Tax=Catenovulum sp. 2E275 TaxID=2980497 RepID=UPI0021CEFB0F|nr:HipA N-terminal domain-containing protein [Catenovulum sp. 2E275]MCU4677514.1 HipA N-terminal domain-containing protein [Catenovulum sp. 2E275]